MTPSIGSGLVIVAVPHVTLTDPVPGCVAAPI
jgi:hypothetical protein